LKNRIKPVSIWMKRWKCSNGLRTSPALKWICQFPKSQHLPKCQMCSKMASFFACESNLSHFTGFPLLEAAGSLIFEVPKWEKFGVRLCYYIFRQTIVFLAPILDTNANAIKILSKNSRYSTSKMMRGGTFN
jgi:hypothetical protein